jgi:hypothetical protein
MPPSPAMIIFIEIPKLWRHAKRGADAAGYLAPGAVDDT